MGQGGVSAKKEGQKERWDRAAKRYKGGWGDDTEGLNVCFY